MAGADNQLVDRAIQGDVEALSALLEHHGPLVRDRIEGEIAPKWRSMLSVDDVMQQTYTDTFLTIQSFEQRSDDSFESWLVTRARRNLLDAVRMLSAQKRGGNRQRIEICDPEESVAALFEYLAGTDSTPSRHAARNEACVVMREMIDRLSTQHRRVIWMYDIECQPVEDVAAALRRSVGAVYMLRARAHDRLRKLMGEAQNYWSDKG